MITVGKKSHTFGEPKRYVTRGKQYQAYALSKKKLSVHKKLRAF